MRCTPDFWPEWIGEREPEPKVHYFDAGDVLIEATIQDPKSMHGRSIQIHILPEQVVPVMKALKEAAIIVRQRAMTQ